VHQAIRVFWTEQSNLSLIHSGSLISSIPVLGLTTVLNISGVLMKLMRVVLQPEWFWNFSTSYSLTNGSVAYYPFNGNANDSSGYGNNPTTVYGITMQLVRMVQLPNLIKQVIRNS